MRFKKEIKLISETIGNGELIEKGKWYTISIRMWLNKGDEVIWKQTFGLYDGLKIEDNGKMMTTTARYDREFLINGIFYGIEGMKIGGKRKIRIDPRFGYREKGIEDMIPPNAVLLAEVEIIKRFIEYDK